MNFDPENVRLVVCDLDNTLVAPPDRRFTPATLFALGQLTAMGMALTVATGRSWPSFKPFYDQLPLNAPLVLLNGASLYLPAEEEELFRLSMDGRWALKVHEEALLAGVQVNLYMGHEVYYAQENDWTRYACEKEHLEGHVADLKPMLEKGPSKLLLVGEPGVLADFRLAFQNANPEAPLRMVFSEPDYLEVLHAGANKFTALLLLLEALGVEAANVLAFGDNENDAEMLQGVGMGVAVANAPEHVRRAAAAVCPPVHEDGVAQFLNALFKMPAYKGLKP